MNATNEIGASTRAGLPCKVIAGLFIAGLYGHEVLVGHAAALLGGRRDCPSEEIPRFSLSRSPSVGFMGITENRFPTWPYHARRSPVAQAAVTRWNRERAEGDHFLTLERREVMSLFIAGNINAFGSKDAATRIALVLFVQDGLLLLKALDIHSRAFLPIPPRHALNPAVVAYCDLDPTDKEVDLAIKQVFLPACFLKAPVEVADVVCRVQDLIGRLLPTEPLCLNR